MLRDPWLHGATSMIPTSYIRFVRRAISTDSYRGVRAVLQQQWIDPVTGIEVWRDVPEVNERTSDAEQNPT